MVQKEVPINFSPFIGTTIILFFMFSTVYTLWYIYNIDLGAALNVKELGDVPDPSSITVSSTGIFGFAIRLLDGILEIISIFSPLVLVKGIILEITKDTPFIYTLINLLIIRPASWAVDIIIINFAVSKIPTVSGESG